LHAPHTAEILEQHFIGMDIEAIKSILVCTTPQEDFWVWYFKKTGLFTLCSAYQALVHKMKV
jgi:LPS sulfotransferase NodH